ncbi:VOC family protein [Kribbella sp. NPDC049227]|uniref:VOC family protein n=1 Tax=Kribbella sp. NPDC049227 TaxID=3364113 RepID=UPI0037208BA6
MDNKLEPVVVPVSDVDRCRHFYRALGFRLDLDRTDGNGRRVVQLTHPGSQSSIVLGTGTDSAPPGSARTVLKVPDLEAARAELLARGAAPGPMSRCQDGSGYLTFRDPDGNQWMLVGDVPAR